MRLSHIGTGEGGNCLHSLHFQKCGSIFPGCSTGSEIELSVFTGTVQIASSFGICIIQIIPVNEISGGRVSVLGNDIIFLIINRHHFILLILDQTSLLIENIYFIVDPVGALESVAVSSEIVFGSFVIQPAVFHHAAVFVERNFISFHSQPFGGGCLLRCGVGSAVTVVWETTVVSSRAEAPCGAAATQRTARKAGINLGIFMLVILLLVSRF